MLYSNINDISVRSYIPSGAPLKYLSANAILKCKPRSPGLRVDLLS